MNLPLKTKISTTQWAVMVAAIVMAANGLLYIQPIYQTVGAISVLWINDLTNVVAALLCVWLGFRLWRSFNRGEILSAVWGSLTVGFALWTIAEIIWDSYQLFLNITLPPVSAADLAWLTGYLALIVGLALRLHTLQLRPTKAWQLAILAAFGTLIIPAVIYIVIPILNDTETGSFLERIVNLFYPVGDMVLVFLALLLVLVLERGLLSRPWTVIALGCFCFGVSDLSYAFATWQGIFQVDPAAGLDLLSYGIDMSYTLAYVLLALGLYLEARLLDVI